MPCPVAASSKRPNHRLFFLFRGSRTWPGGENPLPAISTAALLRFASAGNNGLRPSRPYWLGRLRNSGLSVASCHRGRELCGYAACSIPSGGAVRFSAGPQSLFQTAADCIKAPGLAGSNRTRPSKPLAFA